MRKRKSIRLPNYDYSQVGWYYVTICTKDRKCVFGKIVNGEMKLNDVGEMMNMWWLKIPKRFQNVRLNEYQIMPNHIHGIIIINNGRTHGSAPTMNRIKFVVGVDPCVDPNNRQKQLFFKIIQWFKTMTTNHYIRGVRDNNWQPFSKRLWQRNYYEHIIRNEKSLNKIRKYIRLNPLIWDRDRNNPDLQFRHD